MTEKRFRQAFLLLLLAPVIAPLLVVLGTGANEALRLTEIHRPRLERPTRPIVRQPDA
jgi:hypothetical protein